MAVVETSIQSLREYYLRFAQLEAADSSPIYAEWARGVAADEEVLRLLLTLPQPKRQANLLFAAARLLGAGVGEYPALHAWLLSHWEETRQTMLDRSTQTNEAGRCAVLLPVLASITEPIALIEVGASAGLCLYPDRYSYHYLIDGRTVAVHPASGPSPVALECTLANTEPPERMPDVAWRAGLDLNPIDITDEDQQGWLQTLIWPEQQARRERLAAAAALVAGDPPRLEAGDLFDDVESLMAQAPAHTQLVVFHSAVLAYAEAEKRDRFPDLVQSHPEALWISNEGRKVLPGISAQVSGPDDGRFVLSVNGDPIALTGPHGQSFEKL